MQNYAVARGAPRGPRREGSEAENIVRPLHTVSSVSPLPRSASVPLLVDLSQHARYRSTSSAATVIVVPQESSFQTPLPVLQTSSTSSSGRSMVSRVPVSQIVTESHTVRPPLHRHQPPEFVPMTYSATAPFPLQGRRVITPPSRGRAVHTSPGPSPAARAYPIPHPSPNTARRFFASFSAQSRVKSRELHKAMISAPLPPLPGPEINLIPPSPAAFSFKKAGSATCSLNGFC